MSVYMVWPKSEATIPAPLWLFSEFGAVYKYSDLLTFLLGCTPLKIPMICTIFGTDWKKDKLVNKFNKDANCSDF